MQDHQKQVASLVRWAKEKGYESELFEDPGYSSANFDRPGFQEMMDRVQQGKIDAIVIYKLDRMGRNTREMLNLVYELEEYGCNLLSISENIDPSTAMGRAFMQMLMVFAELEHNIIKERTRWALEQIKNDNEGKPPKERHWIGRPPRGYTSSNGKLRELTKEELEEQRLRFLEKLEPGFEVK
jgi:site-specific DNA recombinase